MMKIGRNDKCHCGSGKKYKKCHLIKENLIKNQVDDFMKKQVTMMNNRNVVDSIKRTDITDDDFLNGNKILYVVNTDNLPNEIRGKVKNLLDTKIFYEKTCWFNSSTLSLKINGVEKVDGWYGTKFSNSIDKKYKEYHLSMFQKVGELDNGFHLMKCNQYNDFEIWDMKNKDNPVRWNRHSWNRYNGIDFDITPYLMRNKKELFSDNDLLDWVEYREFNIDKSIEDTPITQSILEIYHHPIYERVGNVRRLN